MLEASILCNSQMEGEERRGLGCRKLLSCDHLKQLPVDLSLFLSNSLQRNSHGTLPRFKQTPHTPSKHKQTHKEPETLSFCQTGGQNPAQGRPASSSLQCSEATSSHGATHRGASHPTFAFFTSSAVLTNRRGVFFGLSRLRRHGPLQEGLWAGLIGNAEPWQWWLDFPTKLLEVPL